MPRKRNDLDGARDVFERAGKCRFDYPEYIFEAHIAFEHQNGDLDEFEQVERRIRKQMKGVTANRMRVGKASHFMTASSLTLVWD